MAAVKDVTLLRLAIKGVPCIAAATPYSRLFIEGAKNLGGAFHKTLPIKGRDAACPYWVFGVDKESALKTLCCVVYGVSEGVPTIARPEDAESPWRGRRGAVRASGADLITEFGNKIAQADAATSTQSAPPVTPVQTPAKFTPAETEYIALQLTAPALEEGCAAILANVLIAFMASCGEPNLFDLKNALEKAREARK